jgi:hypothetical protein
VACKVLQVVVVVVECLPVARVSEHRKVDSATFQFQLPNQNEASSRAHNFSWFSSSSISLPSMSLSSNAFLLQFDLKKSNSTTICKLATTNLVSLNNSGSVSNGTEQTQDALSLVQ